ncbi:hypothetical protein E4T56_gene13848 [Termitomyces sp. T112]|nr:hypothetical protein E4T56_gene13848 [Termitomyces sp. T112]
MRKFRQSPSLGVRETRRLSYQVFQGTHELLATGRNYASFIVSLVLSTTMILPNLPRSKDHGKYRCSISYLSDPHIGIEMQRIDASTFRPSWEYVIKEVEIKVDDDPMLPGL